jgi:hypothetical protein
MTQSRQMSLVEAITNVAVGYILAIVTQIVVFPWFGLEVTLGEHLAIGSVFVAISLARGYLLRRLFEMLRVASQPGDHGGHVEPEQTRR